MDIKINANSFFVFDLDDTLYQEIDFLKSGYRHISSKLATAIGADIYEQMWTRYNNKENVFKWIMDEYGPVLKNISVEWLLGEYRNHLPKIDLNHGVHKFLEKLKEVKVPIGLITDGRSITQRNKLRSLGIENYFKEIIISEEFGSEKPDERNYLYFNEKYPQSEFIFFADNTSKDFIVPAKLNWLTFCLQNPGNNIHLQSLGQEPLPDFIISSLSESNLLF